MGIETLGYDLIFSFFDTRSLPRQYIDVYYNFCEIIKYLRTRWINCKENSNYYIFLFDQLIDMSMIRAIYFYISLDKINFIFLFKLQLSSNVLTMIDLFVANKLYIDDDKSI